MRNIYWFIKRIYNALKAFYLEISKPSSFFKGEEFEKCIRKKVFVPSKYELVMKTHDYNENKKDYVESSLYPDYLFRNLKTGEEFFVEVKYRERLWDGKLNWCKPYQFKRYKKANLNYKIIIAIGLGGRPRNPESVYLIPLDQIKYDSLNPSFFEKYKFDGKRKGIIDSLFDRVYEQ
ncbi:MAG: hypothetical protein H8E14_10930 [Candidatus Marinimicrobia bacterium]|nr:hypothetical protein [Candidatus Neomarinimicrobiota bacterium]